MKKILIVLLLIFLTPTFSNANEIVEDYFFIAMNYQKEGNSQKAMEYINYILQIEPNNSDALKLKSILMPETFEKSKISPFDTMDTPDELCKKEKPMVKENTQLLRPKENITISVPQIDLKNVEYNSNYYNKQGQEYYKKGNIKGALEYFQKAIKLDKKNYIAYNNLGMAYLMQDNIRLSQKYLKQANKINKNYTQPLVNLSMLYSQIGNKKLQLKYLKKAIKINPTDFSAYYLLGEYYKGINDYQNAIKSYKASIQTNPKFAPSYLSLSIAFFETEEFNWALKTLKIYVKLNTKSDFAYALIAKCERILCDYDSAKSDLLEAIKIKDIPQYRFEYGKVEYAQKNYVEALTIFNDLTDYIKQDGELYNYIGLSYYKLKQIDNAITAFNKAIELNKLRPMYYYNLAQCYKTLGKKQDYVKYTNTATQIVPLNVQDYIDLAQIYYDNGNPNYSINILNNGIQNYPNLKSLYLAKLKLYGVLSDSENYNITQNEIEMRFNRHEK